MVAVGGRSLSTDLLLDGRWTSVEESASEAAIVGAIVDAIDIVLEWSAALLEEAKLVDRVWVPGAVGYPPWAR